MPKYIAFLRAINVGGRYVKMDVLRPLVEELGYTNVETFIASGNVIFDTPETDTDALEAALETAFKAGLGYEVATFIRSPAEVAAVAIRDPFNMSEEEALSVMFLKAPLTEKAQEKLLTFNSDIDIFHSEGRELYWLARPRTVQSPISGPKLEKALRVQGTVRNITTPRRLAAKYAPSQEDKP